MPDNTGPISRLSTRTLQKCVDAQTLRAWAPARQRIGLVEAWKIIKNHFCAAVVTRGVCPVDCARCREEIVDLFRLEQAVNPAALLTWLAKDHSARWIEKLIAADKAEQEFRGGFPAPESQADLYAALFPKSEEDNLIEELRKFYGETA